MKVIKPGMVTVFVLMMSSLLLVFAANCSFEKQPSVESIDKQAKETNVEQSAKEDSVGEQTKEDSPEEKTEDKLVVANPFCAACHYGFDEEELAVNHELVGIGCERCHGESQRHRSDEDNITPPELMYPKARINPTCMMCHPRHEIIDVAHHKPILSGAKTIFDEGTDEDATREKCCTDCHGKQHRINVRTIRWNKATGELLEQKQ